MFCRSGHDHFQHTAAVAQHVVIPKTKNPVALRLEPSIAINVARILGVLSAIDFDDDAPLVADEVDDEAADQRLSPEAEAIETMCAHR